MQENYSTNHVFKQSHVTSKRDQKGHLYLQNAGLVDDLQRWKMDTKLMKEESSLETNVWARRQNCRSPEQVSEERSCLYLYGNMEELGEGQEIKYFGGSKASDNVVELKATVNALQNSISYLEEENMSLHKDLRDKRAAICITASDMCPNKTREGYQRPWESAVKSDAHSHTFQKPKSDPTFEKQGNDINSEMKLGELKVKEQTLEVELESDTSTSEATYDYSNNNNPHFPSPVKYIASESNKDMFSLQTHKMRGENVTNQNGEINGDSDKKSLLRKLSETEKQKKSCLKDLRRLVQKYEESREQLKVQNAAFERALQEKHALFLNLQKRQEENESLSSTLSETKQEKQKLQDALQRAREESDAGNQAGQASREECRHLTEAAYRLIREKQLLEEMQNQLRKELEDCRHRLQQSDDDTRDLREKVRQLTAEKKELLTKTEKERDENEQLETALMEKERANHFAQKELEELRHRCNATEQKLQAELKDAKLGQSTAAKSAEGMREELRATGRLVRALKEDKQLLQREVDESNRATVRAEAEAKRTEVALLEKEELARELLGEKDMMELELQQLRADYLHLSDRIAIRLREMHIEDRLGGNENRSADDGGDGDGVGNGK